MRHLIATLLLALLLPAAALAQETTAAESDRSFITRILQNALSGAGRQVAVEGFEGALSSQATIARLTISDDTGVWLDARGLTMRWNRRALLDGRVEIGELSADQISLLRAPGSVPEAPKAEATPFALPELPVSINIASLDVGRITLDESLLGEALAFSLAGKVALEGGEGTAEIHAERQDGGAGSFDISGGWSNATRVLALQANLAEAPGGIIARLIGLPGAPSVALTLGGTGPIDDYSAELTLATDGAERVTGSFGLVSAEGESRLRADVSGDVTPLIPQQYAAFFGPDSRIALQGRRDGEGNLRLDSFTAQAATLDLTGSGIIDPSGWPLKLSLDGTLGREDGAPLALPFAGGAEAREALIELSYDVEQGPLWHGLFVASDVRMEGVAIGGVSLTGSGEITPDAKHFAADLAYSVTGLALADPGLTAALGTELNGVVSFGREAGENLTLRRLTLNGPGLAADGSGEIIGPMQALRLDLALGLDAADLSRFAPLAGVGLTGAASLDLTARIAPLDGMVTLSGAGATTDLGLGIAQLDPLLGGAGQIDFTLVRDTEGTRVEGLHIATAGVVLAGSANLRDASGQARFDLTVPDVSMALPGLSGLARLTGSADYGAAGLHIAVDASAETLAAEIDARLADARWTGNASLTLPRLAAFSALAGTPLGGAATLTLNGSAAQDFSTLALALDGTTQDLAGGPPQVAALLAGPGTLTGSLGRRGGVISLDGLTFTNEALSLEATGNYDGDEASGQARAHLADLGLVQAGLSGPATADATGSYTPRALSVDLDLTGPAGAQVSGNLARSNGPFGFTLTAILPDLAGLAATQTLADLPLTGAAVLQATGTATPETAAIAADVSAQTQNLALGIAPLDALLAGQGRLSATIRSEAGALSAQNLTLTTPALRASGRAERGSDGALTAGITLSRLDLAPLTPALSGSASADVLFRQTADGALTLRLGAEGPGSMALDLAADGPDVSALTISLDARAESLSPYAALAGMALSGGVSLTANGTLDLPATAFDLDLDASASSLGLGIPALAPLLAGNGRLAGHVARGADGTVQVDGLQADWPSFSASADLSQTDAGGRGSFTARLADVGLFVPGFNGPATAQGSAELAGGSWIVDAALTGPGGANAQVTGSFAGGTADLAANGALQLGLINGFIAPRRLDGTANFDLRLNGAPALENLSGSVSFTGAQVSLPTFSTAITGLDGQITLTGGTARLNVTGTHDSGGTIEVAGSIGLGSGYPAALALSGRRIDITDPKLYTTRLDADLRIDGPITGGALIGGTVRLFDTELRVPSSNFSLLGELPAVRHIGAPAPVVATLGRAGLTLAGTEADAGEGGSSARPFGLDLTIDAPARIFVRGRGLDAELGGSLRLTGTTADIIPVGSFSLIRGRLDILGQRLQLTEGSAALSGDFNPTLALTASTISNDDITIVIRIDGSALDPAVTFSSSPDLPQDEVLAHLLFGTDVASMSPLQAVQLAAAVSTLAGRGGGGIIDSFRQGLGLDDLDISTDEAGNAALEAGKYLSQNIYATVSVGSETTEVELNLDLTDDITARGAASSDGTTVLGIYYERDY